MPAGVKVVKKDKLRVIAHVKDYIVSGDVYLYEDSRLSDILNAEPDRMYLPMTDVIMKSKISDKKIKKDFMLINKNHIELLYLDDKSKDASATYTKQAKEYLNKLNFDYAITEAQRAIFIDETNAEAHYILGIALGKKGKLNEAVKHFELAVKYAPKDSKIALLAQDMINQIKI
jgi:tetratricopeptide (TPR) repeat protein